jgi:hypothetical protein
MIGSKRLQFRISRMTFVVFFGWCLLIGGTAGWTAPARAAPQMAPDLQTGGYAGPDVCAGCHEQIHETWSVTRHAQAFSSPIFQQDWEQLEGDLRCLECHTTGYDPGTGSYAFEGVTCESCHGPFVEGHPRQPMPVTPNAELCETCHESTTDEWRASKHSQVDIVCEDCHNPHSQDPKAESVSALCSNCHKDRGSSFTHGTHADAGLECSNCHMFTSPRTGDPIGGLVPTGHTFAVGSDACIGCHQDTVHTRDVILSLRGETEQISELDPEQLRLKLQEQEEQMEDLEASRTTRLYTGLAQGAIVGLATGSVAAWIVSRRIRIVEQDEEVEQEGEGDAEEES